jgi:hypothetical protein
MDLFKLDGVKVGVVKLDLKGHGLAAKSGNRAVILKTDELVDRVSEKFNRAEAFVSSLRSMLLFVLQQANRYFSTNNILNSLYHRTMNYSTTFKNKSGGYLR